MKHGVVGITKALSVELAPHDIQGRVPLGRIGVPDDVARAALFAASDMSILMSGSILFVDSGESAL